MEQGGLRRGRGLGAPGEGEVLVGRDAAIGKRVRASKQVVNYRIKRLEEQIAKLNARKAAVEAQLADPAVYGERQKLDAALTDQAYLARELEQLEGEWLQKQAELERMA